MSDAGTTTPPPAPAATDWFATADDETKGFFQNRGLDKRTAPEAAMQLAKDFRETQSKLGIPADRVVRWPADATDEANWKTVHQKLGVPETPDGYDFAAVKFADGSPLDDSFVAFMRDTAAKLKVPKEAAAALADAFIKFGEKAEADDTVRQGAALGAAQQELATSWGTNTAVNTVIANRTAGLLGFDPEFINGLPADKYVPFMQKMLEAGSRMGEATLIGAGSGNGGATPRVMTREGATARMEELGQDKAWYARFSNPSDPGHKEAIEEWRHLNRLQASGGR